MTLLTSTTDVGGILPPEYGDLIVAPLIRDSIAFNPAVSTIVRTSETEFHVPILVEDAAAAWVVEGAEITPDDPTLDELVILPKKVAGLSIISRELALDSSPSAQKIVGESLARSIVAQVDRAFFGDLAAPAPKGLASVTGTSVVDIGTGFTDLDAFAEAIAEAESVGATISAFLLHPTDALAVAKLKEATGSNKGLVPDPRNILGVPLVVSQWATAGVSYGVDKTRIVTVLREGTTVAVSDQAYFSSDRVGIRATARVAFGFPVPLAIVKMHDAA